MQRKDTLLIMALRWALSENSEQSANIVCDEINERRHELSHGTKTIIRQDIIRAMENSEVVIAPWETVMAI